MLSPFKKQKTAVAFKFLIHQEGGLPREFLILQKKCLIGSFEHADLVLKDESVSHYHALVTVDSQGFVNILDLHSVTGVHINGQRVQNNILSPGDHLQIGKVQLSLEEHLSTDESLQDLDDHIQLSSEQVLDAPIISSPPKEGLTLIDGEYCDITFDESPFIPVTEIPLSVNLPEGSYADFDERTDNLEIFKSSEETCLEVVTMATGVVLSIDYLPLKDATFSFHPRKATSQCLVLPSLEAEGKTPFCVIKNRQVQLLPLPEHKLSNYNHPGQLLEQGHGLKDKELLCYQRGTIQIFVRLNNKPPRISPPPFFGRDREFQKEVAKIVFPIIGLFLLLIFIDTKVEEKVEKVAVIYKRAIRTEKAQTAEKNSNVDQKDGTQSQPNQDKTLAKAAAPQNQAKPEQAPPPKAEAKPAASAPKADNKMKAFKFDVSTALAGISGKSAIQDASVQAKSASNASVQSAVTATAGSLSASSSTVGSLSGSTSGRDLTGGGTQGLSSKNGIDTAYIEPKTVVLGSMDPELLRKILQEHLPQFRHCYQQELQENSEKIQGVVDLEFRIEKNGAASKVGIKSKGAKFSQKGVNCMGQVLSLIEFPKPKGGGVVDVRQPLNFFSETNVQR